LEGTIILLIVLVLFSAFFSASETALMSITKLKVLHLIEQKKKNAKIVYDLKMNPHRLLVTILIGNNIVNVSAASIAGVIGREIFKNYGLGIAIAVMTLVILIFGEIIPKTYSVKYDEKMSLFVAPIILFFTYLFHPIHISLDFVNRLVGIIVPEIKKPLITEAELRTIVKFGEHEGSIKKEEEEMIYSVFEMDDTEVKEIMVPRVDMFSLNQNRKISEVIQEIIEKGYSRIPVYGKTVDNIKGIVYIKDILPFLKKGNLDIRLKEIMKPTIFVTENKRINTLLKQFKENKIHIALVVDEYGGIQGLVTIEDILEELVGEIYDETDVPVKLIKIIDKNISKINGGTNLDEVNEILNLNLEKTEDYETISGYILYKIGRIPTEGETIFLENLKFNIDKMEGNRIKEVTLTKIPIPDKSPDDIDE
jgi:CBS domain containing-hemolysin-like protein